MAQTTGACSPRIVFKKCAYIYYTYNIYNNMYICMFINEKLSARTQPEGD